MVHLQKHLLHGARQIAYRIQEVMGREVRRHTVMGGGSILAAKYGHRKSTDIDLWVRQQVVDQWKGMRDVDFFDYIRDMLVRTGNEQKMLEVKYPSERGQIKGLIEEGKGGTPFSITPLAVSGFEERMQGRERVGDIIWESLTETEILTGKLRRIWKGETTQRDVYDLVAAAARNPSAVNGALKSMSATETEKIVDNLEKMPTMAAVSSALDSPVIDLSGNEQSLTEGTVQHVARGIKAGNAGAFPKEDTVLMAVAHTNVYDGGFGMDC